MGAGTVILAVEKARVRVVGNTHASNPGARRRARAPAEKAMSLFGVMVNASLERR